MKAILWVPVHCFLMVAILCRVKAENGFGIESLVHHQKNNVPQMPTQLPSIWQGPPRGPMQSPIRKQPHYPPGHQSQDNASSDDFEQDMQHSGGRILITLPELIQVHIGLYIASMGSFRPKEMTYEIDLFLRMSWNDKRLVHNYTGPVIFRDKYYLSKIWLPDLFFPNARVAKFQDVTQPNFVIYVYSNGTISYTVRTTLEIACNMNLQHYPMDRQSCNIKIMSFGRTSSVMSVKWFHTQPINKSDEIELPQFTIAGINHTYCNGRLQYAFTADGYELDDFSCLLVVFDLHRSMGYHMVQTYLPTSLIVIISWVSFWIDRNAVPARVTLSFTTLLTLFTQGAAIRYSLPPVSYSKAIDYWFGACVLFVFAALLEFTFVNSLMRSSQRLMDIVTDESHKRWQRKKRLAGGDPYNCFRHAPPPLVTQLLLSNGETTPPLSDAMKTTLVDWSVINSQKALCIDKTSRVLFPVLFFGFAFLYWTFYLFVVDMLTE